MLKTPSRYRHRMDPGYSVVEQLGGAAIVARALGLAVSTTMRWGLAAEAGGTGGIVPAKYHRGLEALAKARRARIDLTAPVARVARPATDKDTRA